MERFGISRYFFGLNRAVHSRGGVGGGAVAPVRKKLNVFFSNIVFEFTGLFLVAILRPL